MPDIWADPYGWNGPDSWPYWPEGPGHAGVANADGSKDEL